MVLAGDSTPFKPHTPTPVFESRRLDTRAMMATVKKKFQ